jgi:hypothetical protein
MRKFTEEIFELKEENKALTDDNEKTYKTNKEWKAYSENTNENLDATREEKSTLETDNKALKNRTRCFSNISCTTRTGSWSQAMKAFLARERQQGAQGRVQGPLGRVYVAHENHHGTQKRFQG